MRCLLFTFVLGLTIAHLLPAQSLTQTVRGRLTDAQSGFPLAGANIIVLHTDPLIGAASDVDGYYALQDVPVGRQALKVSYLGYEDRVISGAIVTSGKELVVNVALTEQIMTAGEVVITGDREKNTTNNEMTTVSSRSFNLEETGRYAGSLNDPARMAANFAGVAANNDDRNDIVIRGNSPAGLLWRLEGINIPNPSHFGSLNSTGGPVSILNYNTLDKSDFMTAAFPAEYGNAIAGVFDLQLRSGNNQQKEWLGQIGFNGFELGAEGPFSKKSKASYIAHYRYSTLGVFNALGVEFGTGAAIPQYQDLTFKIDVPTPKAGRFTVFGLGGVSNITFLGSEQDLSATNENYYADENYDAHAAFKSGVTGISHLYYFNPTTYYKLSLATSHQSHAFQSDSLSTEDRSAIPSEEADMQNNKYSAHLLLSKKFSARNNMTSGVILDVYDFNLQNQWLVPGEVRNIRNTEGQSLLTQAYTEWQHRSDKLTLNAGLNYQHFAVSNSSALNPRAGISYQLSKRQTLGFGYGLNSQIQPLEVYFNQTQLPDGSVLLTNKNLGFVHSHHYVLSYDHMLSANLRMKVETYYQYIYGAGVTRQPSSFSLLNAGADFDPIDATNLVNKGVGHNYGLELTLERFYNNGYYFLLTTSLYDAKYKGSDGVLRSTAFDGGYIANLLGGKEFKVGKKDNTLNVDVKLTSSGGKRYTPINDEASARQGYQVLYEDQAFSQKTKDYFRTDLKVMYRINTRRVTHEIGINLQNITNRQNEFSRIYNPRTNTVQTRYQTGLLPIPQYRILF